MPRPADLNEIQVFVGPFNGGLVPISDDTMYMFVVSQEDSKDRLYVDGAAQAMRARGKLAPPQIAPLIEQITDDDGVVARPIEVVFIEGHWHTGSVVLLGDAIHGSTPHLAQGAGMAIEDGIVLADELVKADTVEAAFTAYRARRFERVEFVAKNSIRIGDMQMGKIPAFDVGALTGQTIGLMAQPI